MGEEEVFDSSKVVTFQVPHNAAVQIYDFKSKKSRVQFGPDMVMLGPEEQFTQLSLSGGKPKKGNMIRAIALLLGPDFASDIIQVETADHARLQLDLSYNWHFEVKDPSNIQDASKIFNVADFVGDLCKAMASKIRGAVSQVTFDDFHKNSAQIIQVASFGTDPDTREQEILCRNLSHWPLRSPHNHRRLQQDVRQRELNRRPRESLRGREFWMMQRLKRPGKS